LVSGVGTGKAREGAAISRLSLIVGFFNWSINFMQVFPAEASGLPRRKIGAGMRQLMAFG
jgi:hypothetical protein